MHAVPGMPVLYRQLVDRHPDLFTRHLVPLLGHRDDEIASLSTSLWRHEEHWASDLQGRQQWLRDNEVDRQRVSDAVRVEVDALREAVRREREMQVELRASWSWRLTKPLRALAGWVRR